LIRDLLPVVDNIDRAIEAASKSNEATSLLEGFKLVRQQLITVLMQHNCTQIEALGKPFDPQFHAAIMQQPSDEVPANHVLLVAQAGYKLHDRVVRPAQVIISTGPAAG
jgi:molecular chaperone GrpE